MNSSETDEFFRWTCAFAKAYKPPHESPATLRRERFLSPTKPEVLSLAEMFRRSYVV